LREISSARIQVIRLSIDWANMMMKPRKNKSFFWTQPALWNITRSSGNPVRRPDDRKAPRIGAPGFAVAHCGI
jgi:hypothetical protein